MDHEGGVVEKRELSVKADTAEFTQADGIGLSEAQIYASGGPKRQRKLEEERAQGAGDEEERPNSLVSRRLAHFRQCSMAASAAQVSCGGRAAVASRGGWERQGAPSRRDASRGTEHSSLDFHAPASN